MNVIFLPYEFDFWYMTIISSDKHVRIEKYMSVYSSEYPDVSVQTSVSSRFYRFAQHGISYRWIHEQREPVPLVGPFTISCTNVYDQNKDPT